MLFGAREAARGRTSLGPRGDNRRGSCARSIRAELRMTKHVLLIGLVTTVLASVARPSAQTPAKNDYRDGRNWLCRPGRQDACAVDQATTIVSADGKLTREEWKVDPAAAIDCFYVYPTVSRDPGGNSDMIAGPEENGVVAAQ